MNQDVKPTKPNIFLAVPGYAPQGAETVPIAGMQLMRVYPTGYMKLSRSLLANCFNMLLCTARENKADLFVMLHDDVVPEPDGLVKLVEERAALGCDVLSAVVPIKNAEGMTSTAIGEPGDEWARPRRLTMHEVMALPETFGIDDVEPGKILLVNTGCMVIDLHAPWIDDFYFTIRDRIATINGRLVSQVIPEDWGMSRFVHERGGTLRATRKVRLRHIGVQLYPNDQAWGSKQTDEAEEIPPLEPNVEAAA